MRAPPTLRGGFGTRLLSLVVGLFLCACGIVCFLESELGLPPWDVLHQGLAERLGVSFGVANLIVSLAVLALVWLLRAHIGLATFLNAVLIGSFVIALTRIDAVDALSDESLGSALYISPAMGAGPRDSLMLVTSSRLGMRIGAARAALEVAALLVGFALGGTVGIGTLVFAVGIGPAVEVSFWLLTLTALAVPEVASRTG